MPKYWKGGKTKQIQQKRLQRLEEKVKSKKKGKFKERNKRKEDLGREKEAKELEKEEKEISAREKIRLHGLEQKVKRLKKIK